MRIERAPDVVLREAHKAAAALQDVIAGKKHKVMFGGEQYLELEDWQTLARFYGLSVKGTGDRYISYGDIVGFEATAEVIRTDGAVVSAASAMCMADEKNWKGKPLFQLRSMAQTRAAAKAFRLCLSWVAVLAGFRGTPAEEMDGLAKTVEEVVPSDDEHESEDQGGRMETGGRPGPAIVLTPEQKTMLTMLGNTLPEPWSPNRYGRELQRLGAFQPVRDLLWGLHKEQCGGTCEHVSEAILGSSDRE